MLRKSSVGHVGGSLGTKVARSVLVAISIPILTVAVHCACAYADEGIGSTSGLIDKNPPTPPILHGGQAISTTSLYVEFTPAKDDVQLATDTYTVYANGSPLKFSVNAVENYGRKYPPPHFIITDLSPGTDYQVTATAKDTSGNVSAHSRAVRLRTKTGDVSGLKPAKIKSPPEGALIGADTVLVYGSVDPAASTVLVNGSEATLEGSIFYANTPLFAKTGKSKIIAVAYAADGKEINFVEVSVVKTRQGEPFAFSASTYEGTPPLSVEFSAGPGEAVTPISYEWDLDGDGKYEVNNPAPVAQRRVYEKPGVVPVSMRVIDSGGIAYMRTLPVRILEHAALDLEITVEGPAGIASDGAGNLYVARSKAGVVAVFDTKGNPLRELRHSSLVSPSDLAVDHASNVYVVDLDSDCIHKFDKSGVFQKSIGCGTLAKISGVSLDGDDLYVAAAPDPKTGAQIYIYDGEGNLNSSFGLGASAIADPMRVGGVIVDSGSIYVADGGRSSVEVFSTSGVHQRTLKASYSSVDLALEPFTKRFLVADGKEMNVQVLDGEFRQKGSAGVEVGVVSTPISLCPADLAHPGMFYASLPQSNKVIRVRLPVDLPTSVLADFSDALEKNDVRKALIHFEASVKSNYRQRLESANGRLGELAKAIRGAVIKSAGAGMCIYAFLAAGEENGKPVNYYREIFFMRDELGIWRIAQL